MMATSEKQKLHLQRLNTNHPWVRSEGQKTHLKKLNSDKFGVKNPNWKGGRYIDSNDYVCLRMNNTYVKEHRIIMENHLGRKLGRYELVHHINQNRQDNKLSNLAVVSYAEHIFIHGVLDGTIKAQSITNSIVEDRREFVLNLAGVSTMLNDNEDLE